MWDIMRSVVPTSSKRVSEASHSLKLNGCTVSDQQIISNQFNEVSALYALT